MMVHLLICCIYLSVQISYAVTQLSYTTASPAPSKVTCNDANGCEITCTGDNACFNTTFDSPSASYLTLTASGASVLEDTVINCPHNAQCTVTAIGYRALAYTYFTCGTDGACDITGGDEKALYRANIGEEDATKITVTVDGGYRGWDAGSIWCPRNQPTPSCIIRVRSDSSPYWSSSLGGPLLEWVYLTVDNADDIEFRCDANSDWDALFTTDNSYPNDIRLYDDVGALCSFELASYSSSDFYGTNRLQCTYKEKGTNYDWMSGKRCLPWATDAPTSEPSSPPTAMTQNPTTSPTPSPTKRPTNKPTLQPSNSPTKEPTSPTLFPSQTPSNSPIKSLTNVPSPTPLPSPAPSDYPTARPSLAPSDQPTSLPTSLTNTPSKMPTETPNSDPTMDPSTVSPTRHPTQSPTAPTTSEPTRTPTTAVPTASTASPTRPPTITPVKLVETTQDENADNNKTNNTAQDLTSNIMFWVFLGISSVLVCFCAVWIVIFVQKRRAQKKQEIIAIVANRGGIETEMTTGTNTVEPQLGPGFSSALSKAAHVGEDDHDESYGSKISLPESFGEKGTMASSTHKRIMSESHDNIFPDVIASGENDRDDQYLDFCVDCTSLKMGKTFDGVFYCNPCWMPYAQTRAMQQAAMQTAGGPLSDAQLQPPQAVDDTTGGVVNIGNVLKGSVRMTRL